MRRWTRVCNPCDASGRSTLVVQGNVLGAKRRRGLSKIGKRLGGVLFGVALSLVRELLKSEQVNMHCTTHQIVKEIWGNEGRGENF